MRTQRVNRSAVVGRACRWVSAHWLAAIMLTGFGASSMAWAQSPQLIERIVAVVDEEAILLSDLDREVESYKFEAQQYGQPIQEDEAAIRQKMLQRLIEVKLLVAQAKLDGIEISEEEVDQAVARSLQDIIDRFGTRANLEKELAQNGMTYSDLETRNRDLIRNRLYTSRMISTHIRPKVEVREDEIRAFYEQHKDEVPKSPGSVTVSNILVVPQPKEDARADIDAKLQAINDALDRGQDFGEVARQYSEGPNASRGGQVGTFGPGDLAHPLLDQALWNVPVGVPSEPITTELGIHIILVRERTDQSADFAQIMIKIPITQDDWSRAEDRASEVYDQVKAGQDFADLVQKYSDDPSSRDQGGLLGDFPTDKLNPTFQQALSGLELGQVAPPVKGSAGYFILRLDARTDPQVMEYEQIKDQLRAAVEQQKIDAELQVFLADLKQKFYIDIKT